MGSTPILPEEYGQLKITPGAMENDLTEEPGFGAVMESMFRLEHPAASAWSYSGPSDMERLEQQEGFDSWNYIKGNWREDYGERYAGVFNTKAALKLDNQILREQDDRRVVHASGWSAYLTALGATALTDPFNFAPGGSIVRGVKTARAVGKSFLSTATAGATAVGASELILQETSETRTGLESAFSIAGGGLFAGFVGAGASALLSRAEIAAGGQFFDALTKAAKPPGEEAADAAQAIIREEMRTGQPAAPLEGDIPAARAGAAGAQARIEATPDDLTLAGGPITKFLANITAFNPVLRANRFASTVAKGEIYKVIENPLMMRMHLRGDEDLAQHYGQNAENLAREWRDARAAEVVDFRTQTYKEHRKAGGTMKSREFDDEVGLALTRGDKHADPHVQKVAENTRKRLFDPLFELAKATYREDGTPLLPKDATIHNAQSYFTEMWRPLAIEAGGGRDFRAMMTEDVARRVDEALARAARVRDAKVGAAQGKIDDLTATPDQYMQRLGDLRQQLDTLNTTNPAAVQAERALERLKRQEKKARDKGDIPQADTVKNQINQAAKQASIDNANYRTARNALQAQIRRLGRGRVGAAERQEQLRNAIVDLEVKSDADLLRLHKQLGTLDQRMVDEGPEAHAEELSEIRTEFAEIMESLVKAEERLATQQAKDREKLMTVADPEAASRETAPPVDFDSTLDAIRSRPKRDPEKKMRSAPAIDFLKANGGVKPGSPLASELAKLGIVPKATLKEMRKLARSFGFRADDLRNLFREDGMERADNLVPDRDGRFADMADTQGYVDEAQLLDAVRSEIFGAPLRSPAELEEIGRFSEANQVADELEFELKDLGVDVRTMSNDEVLERLSVIQADTNRMREMYEGVPPRVSEDEGARELGELEEEGRIGEPPERELTKGEAVITERMRRREQLFDMADRRKSDKLNRAAAEIERLQDVDPEAAVRALDELIATRVSQTAGRVERAGVRIHSLLRRAERLDPRRVDKDVSDLRARIADAERSFADTESIKYGEPGPDRDAYVKDIVENYFHKLTDRENVGGTPIDLVMSKAGPLKERVFPFEQERYWKFMEHDYELVARNYARKMAAEIYLTKKLGAADAKPALARIEADYARLVSEVDSHPKWSETRKEKERNKLYKEEGRAKRDLGALRDLVRGVYKNKENSSGFGRAMAIINTFNYLRIGGGFAIASLTDPARIMMTQGMGRFLGDAVVPLVTNLRGIKGSFEESRLAGVAWADVTNGTAQARMADMDDPWSARSPFEAFLMKASSGFSKLNGLAYWNAFMKGWAGGVIQNRIIHNVIHPDRMNAFERAYMNHMGLTGDIAERIRRQFVDEKHGEFIKRMAIANTDAWTDPIARMAYRAAVRQDVNSTIVTKSVGDMPLFANTPLGRAGIQFKSFAMAGHQRAFLKGIQAMEVGGIKGGADSPVAGVISAMITSTAIGSFIYYLKQIEANREVSDNPGRFLMEGLDRSGLYPTLFEINNTFEKYFGVGAYAAANKMFPDADQTGKASRYATRNMATTLLGPTGDTVETLGRVIMGIQRRDPKTGEWKGWTDGDRRGIRNLLPYSTLPVIKSIFEHGIMPQVTTPAD